MSIGEYFRIFLKHTVLGVERGLLIPVTVGNS